MAIGRPRTGFGGPTFGPPGAARTVLDRQLRLLAVILVVVAGPAAVVDLATPPPAVSSPQPQWADDYFEDMESAAKRYNARAEDLYRVDIWGLNLGDTRAVLNRERVNVYVVDGEEGTAGYSFRLDGETRVRDLRPHVRRDATVRVVVDRAAIERIESEYTQTRAVREAYLDGDIRVTGVGIGHWPQWWLLDTLVRHTVSG